MGYTKLVQYADILEIYEYQNNISQKPISYLTANRISKDVSSFDKKAPKKKKVVEPFKYYRSESSIKRAKLAFFRVCYHNNFLADTIHFCTLTFASDVSYKKANRCLSEFLYNLRKYYDKVENKGISYIGVSEKTKEDRIHYHLLIYNLPSNVAVTERKTRNIQRLWGRGYVDIRFATYKTEGLAGYLVKYMGKNFIDGENERGRGYNCSRNIEKVRSKGGNSFDSYSNLIKPDSLAVKVVSYEVPFLGICIKSKYCYNSLI